VEGRHTVNAAADKLEEIARRIRAGDTAKWVHDAAAMELEQKARDLRLGDRSWTVQGTTPDGVSWRVYDQPVTEAKARECATFIEQCNLQKGWRYVAVPFPGWSGEPLPNLKPGDISQ
jgi:hypothetical protein